MSAIDEIEAIKQLKARYYRAMDTKDWALMRDVFTEDFILDSTGIGGGVLEGRDPVVEFLSQVMDGTRSVHHGHMPEIELTSDVDAAGIWAFADIVIFPDGTRLAGAGHYQDAYRKVDGTWQIASSTVTRLLEETTPPPA